VSPFRHFGNENSSTSALRKPRNPFKNIR
jgi:hypothetical protein